MIVPKVYYLRYIVQMDRKTQRRKQTRKKKRRNLRVHGNPVETGIGTGSLYLRYTNQGQVWAMHVCLSLVGIALFFCFGATEA